MTMFQERFTRDVEAIFADASGLGEDMLEPDTETMLMKRDLIERPNGMGQDEPAAPPQMQLGPLFALLGGALILVLLLAAPRAPRPRLQGRFR
jgi:hypothetical protein